jgi:hypothetical protein
VTATRRATARLDPDELASLEEQRDFLLRSLDDLEAEHDAGDMDDVDYATLRDDYTLRAADILRAIDQHRAAFAEARRPRSVKRTALIVGGVALFALVAGFAISRAVGARQSGQTITGGVSGTNLSLSQQARQCLVSAPPSDLAGITKGKKCFDKVLTEDSTNATALAYKGWYSYLAAATVTILPDSVKEQSLRDATSFEDAAVKADPKLPDARAFQVIVATAIGRFPQAAAYLKELNALHPPALITSLLKQQGVEQAITKGLAQAATSTTTTTTTTP